MAKMTIKPVCDRDYCFLLNTCGDEMEECVHFESVKIPMPLLGSVKDIDTGGSATVPGAVRVSSEDAV